jgi:hypothetical protein
LRNALFTPAFSWKEQQSHPKENGKYNPAIYAGKGEKVPLRQSKPGCGFSWAVALMQITVGGSMFWGMIWILCSSKFLHEDSVLHSIITASVCLRFGSPTSYQHGSVTGPPGVNRCREVRPDKVFHHDRGIVRPTGHSTTKLCL